MAKEISDHDVLMDDSPAPLQERHYYKLLIANIVCLAITSILVIINIAQTNLAAQAIKYERRDIINAIETARFIKSPPPHQR
jgi:hypothetical protein